MLRHPVGQRVPHPWPDTHSRPGPSSGRPWALLSLLLGAGRASDQTLRDVISGRFLCLDLCLHQRTASPLLGSRSLGHRPEPQVQARGRRHLARRQHLAHRRHLAHLRNLAHHRNQAHHRNLAHRRNLPLLTALTLPPPAPALGQLVTETWGEGSEGLTRLGPHRAVRGLSTGVPRAAGP